MRNDAVTGGGDEAVLAALARVDELGRQGWSPDEIAGRMAADGTVVPGGGSWDGDRVERILSLFASARQELGDDGDEEEIAVLAARTAEIPVVPASAPQPAGIAPLAEPAPVPLPIGTDRPRPAGLLRLAVVALFLAVLGAAGYLAIDAAIGGEGSSSELVGDVASPTTAAEPTPTTETPNPADTMAIRIETDAPAAVGSGDPAPATATIRVDGRLHVEGAFVSQRAADEFVSEAAEVFGRENVVEAYVVDPGAPTPQVSDVALDKPVLFESGTDEIHPDYIPFLEACAGVLALNPHIVMSVTGHTDAVGDEEFNLELSQRRAQAIVDFYREREIGDDQLLALGAGESTPVGDNETEEGREANRRAMLQLLNVVGDEAADLE